MSFSTRRSTPGHSSWYAETARCLPVNSFGNVIQNNEGSGIRSASFDGSTGYLRTVVENFQTGNSTIEFWIKPTQYLFQPILHCNASLHIHMQNDGSLHINNGVTADVIMPVQLNVWQHVAIVIDGSSKRVYLNGILKHTTAQLWNSSSNPLFIGKSATVSSFYNGLLAGLRIVKGTALYTTNFPIPTVLPTAVTGTALLMNFGATTAPTWFADSSTAFALVTSVETTLSDEGYGIKAANFNGTTAYLSTPNSTTYNLTGDFTVEAFVKINTRQTQDTFIINGRGAVVGNVFCGWALRQDTTNGLSFYRYDGTESTFGFNFSIPGNNNWYHVAASRTGSTLCTFVNGALTNTHTTSITFDRINSTDPLQLGRGTYQSNQTFYLNGKIAGARVINGTGIYTTNFNVPNVVPLATSGTQLLMNFGSTSAPYVYLNTASTSSVYLSSAVPTGIVTQITRENVVSAYTNREGYLTASLDGTIGSGDFDLSFFVKFDQPLADYSEHVIYQTTGGMAVLRAADETIRINQVGVGDRLVSSVTIRDTYWHYIQVKRSSGSLSMFIDGNSAGSVANSTNFSVKDISLLYNVAGNLFGAEITGVRFSRSGTLSTTVPTSASIQPDVTTTLLMNFGSTGVPSLWYGDVSTTRYNVTLSGGVSLVDEGNGVRAAAFDGTGFLTTTVPGNFPGDFTIEFFAKNNTNANSWYIGNTTASVNGNGWAIAILAGNVIRVSSRTSGYNSPAFSGSITNWNHVAICRSGTNILIFVNGLLLSTTAQTAYGLTFSNTDPIRIGKINDSLNPTGSIASIRVVKGTALYTSNFAVPTAVLANVSGTALLTPFVSTAVPTLWYRDSSTNSKTAIASSGDMQYNFGNRVYAAMFDGNSFLTAYSVNGFDFGTGNWTVEFFVQMLVAPAPGDADCWVSTADPSDFNGIYIGVGPSRELVILASSNNSSWTFSQSTAANLFTAGQWNHVAVVVNSGTLTSYVNGTALSASPISVNIPSANGRILVGGRTRNSQYSTSRIAGLRVVKGTAVYTSDFTTPTTLPTNIIGTELLMNFGSEVWNGLGNTSDRYYSNASLLLKFNGTNGSTTFADSSLNAYTITNFGTGSISTSQSKYGTGSYLGAANSYFTVGTDNTPFAFGTGDFTIEFWYYATSTAAQHNIVLFSNLTNSAIIQLGATFRYQLSNISRITSTTITINTWYHVAVSRVSGTTRMFLNGTLQATTYADATDYLSTGTPWQFGGNVTAPIVGYMDDLCITKGVGKYIVNFTPTELFAF